MEITNLHIDSFLEKVEPERISDVETLISIGKELTGKEPVMWGTIVGFGKLHYKYPSGHEGDMPRFGFANRKLALTLYMSYDIEPYEELKSLGKHQIGKGCLYIRRLCDVNMDVLKQLIVKASNDVLKHDFITLMDEES
jgi:hypothetical protein